MGPSNELFNRLTGFGCVSRWVVGVSVEKSWMIYRALEGGSGRVKSLGFVMFWNEIKGNCSSVMTMTN